MTQRPFTRRRRDLARAIEQWEQNLIDADTVLADTAADIERAVLAHQIARRERERVAVHLRLLTEIAAKAPQRGATR